MTLVIGYANTDFITMVADRRITRGKELVDDSRTKIVNWENKVLIGFTGIAVIGSERRYTMEWLANLLAKNKKFSPQLIATEITPLINQMNINRKFKRLAFMASGYTTDGKFFYSLISNMHDNDGNLLAVAREDFWISTLIFKIRGTIKVIGQRIPASASQQLLEQLLSTHGKELPSESTIHNILSGVIEKSSSEYVSSTCLIVTIRNNSSQGVFNVVTPNSKPGQKVDIASPYLVIGSLIINMPSQQLKLSKPL